MVILFGLQDFALELPHLAGDLAKLTIHGGLGLVVGRFLLHILDLNLLEVLPHGAECLDLRCQFVLLLLELGVDLGNDRGDLVKGFALGLVHVGLLHRGFLQHGLCLAQAGRRGILGLQDLLRAEQHRHLMPEVAELGLQSLELGRLVPERGGVVLELLLLHELVTLHLLVLALLHVELLAQAVALLVQLLLVLHDHLLLLRDEVRLLLVHREP
mmetsp:Transcript_72500/g.216297  ORF Transcript_72500/g.216297 Transcript_72500/m.216297 type:complete len:214 (+) Transcript_72500:413-1054(+)